MSEFLESMLFPVIEKNETLVFPTEESARSVSIEYVLSKKKGIFKDRCISFDTFAEKFYHTEGKSPASDYDKEIFCNCLIEEYAENLKYIFSHRWI